MPIEQETLEFHQRVRDGYAEQAKHRDRMVRIDAGADEATVLAQIKVEVKKLLVGVWFMTRDPVWERSFRETTMRDKSFKKSGISFGQLLGIIESCQTKGEIKRKTFEAMCDEGVMDKPDFLTTEEHGLLLWEYLSRQPANAA